MLSTASVDIIWKPPYIKIGDIVKLRNGEFPDVKQRFWRIKNLCFVQDEIWNLDLEDWNTISHIDHPSVARFEQKRYNIFRVGDEVQIRPDITVNPDMDITEGMFIHRGVKAKVCRYEFNVPTEACFYYLNIDSSYRWHQEALVFSIDGCLASDYETKFFTLPKDFAPLPYSAPLIVEYPTWFDGTVKPKQKQELEQQSIDWYNKLFKQQNNENRLQKPSALIRGAEKRTGNSVCCGRSKAAVTSRHLSYQAVTS